MPFIGQEPITGAYSVLDDITTSATATYNLQKNSVAYSPASANHLLVSLNGVIQKPGSSFTVSGSQITFSEALTAQDSIDFIMALGDVLSVGTPTDGSVDTSQLATNAVETAKINNSAVTTAKINDAAVTSAKLASGIVKVKQIVSNNIDTQLEVGSGVTPDWSAAETTITPTSNTNPILVMINTYIKNTTTATRGNAQLRRKTNSGSFGNIGGAYYLYSAFSNTSAAGYQFYHQRWDNPTRSAGDSLTYTIQLSRAAGSDSIFLFGDSNHPANITLIEFEGTTEDDGA